MPRPDLERNTRAMAGRKWTEEELNYLRSQYGTMSAQGIADEIGRTKSSVQTKARELDLTDEQASGLWSDEDIAFLRENYLKLGADECARQLGRSVASVHGKIRKVGGGRPSIGPKVEWSDAELDFLRENYNLLSWEDLSEQLGRTEQAIQVRASMLGLQRYVDPYPFFEQWSEESAYIVGFFAADGWAVKRGPESVRIGFAQKDPDILYTIRDTLNTGEVYKAKRGMHRYYFQSVRTYEWMCRLFGRDVSRKCHTLQWPSVPDAYIRHFMRGAVDGDGSLFRRKQDGLWDFAYTTSSEEFIRAFSEKVLDKTGIELNLTLNKINVWHARSAGIKAVCLSDWLYRDAAIALERKAWIAREMMNSSGICYGWNLTPKMREMFPHILERYEIVESAVQ